MFSIAILIGIYSYLIFSLGIVSLLSAFSVSLVTFIFVFIVAAYLRFTFSAARFNIKVITRNVFFFSLLVIQGLINFVGVLGPELSFDALWYHLTIPKIFLQNQSIFFIPGGLYYYSVMPKLTEMLYLLPLALGSEIGAKLIHFLFGVGCVFVTYKLARVFVPERLSLLASLVFYSNLVVGWESITAYVDLSRAFFESLALLAILLFFKTNKQKYCLLSAVMIGLAISVKVLAIGSLAILVSLILFWFLFYHKNTRLKQIILYVMTYSLFALFIPLPWFVLSFVNTGNPIFPFFTSLYPVSVRENMFTISEIAARFGKLFFRSDDPISPVYSIFFPLIVFYRKKLTPLERILALYCAAALAIWYVTPQTGGGRFILPYLSSFSVITVVLLSKVLDTFVYKLLTVSIVTVFFLSIGYRALANLKFLPVILGRESREEFLIHNLNFSFGDFYDTRDEISKIVHNDRVLIYGGHNLFYAKFNFTHESYIKKGDVFRYILTINSNLPERFAYWTMIYENDITKSRLYTHKKQEWIY